MGLAAARALRDEARKQLAAGRDPSTEKRIADLARKVAANNTFKTIAEEWVAKIGGGLTPIIATALFAHYKASLPIAVYLAAMCIVSFASVMLLGKSAKERDA